MALFKTRNGEPGTDNKSVNGNVDPVKKPEKTKPGLQGSRQKSIHISLSKRAMNGVPDDKSVLSALEMAYAKFNIRPRVFGGDWARVPAVWRGSRDFNLSVNLKTGTVVDFADAGSAKDSYKKFAFKELMEFLEFDPGDVNIIPVTKLEVQNTALQRVKEANSFYKKGVFLTSANRAAKTAIAYLLSRGIPEAVINRLSNQVKAIPTDYNGAILALPIYQPKQNGAMIGIQRVFLTPEGGKYGDEPKKMLGSHFDGNLAGGFLIAGDHSRFKEKEVAIVEGFETGLAVHAATGMPVYVMYDSAGMKGVNLEYLSFLGVTSLLIAGDNDDPDKFGKRAGQEAAIDLANRSYAENIPVRVAIPDRSHTDGNPADWLNIWEKDPAGCTRMLLSSPPYQPGSLRLGPPAIRKSMQNSFSK